MLKLFGLKQKIDGYLISTNDNRFHTLLRSAGQVFMIFHQSVEFMVPVRRDQPAVPTPHEVQADVVLPGHARGRDAAGIRSQQAEHKPTACEVTADWACDHHEEETIPH